MLRRLRPSRKSLILAAAALLVALIVFAGTRSRAPEPRELAFTELLSAIHAGTVTDVVVRPDALHIAFKDGTQARSVPPPGYVSANPTFMTDLARRNGNARKLRNRRRHRVPDVRLPDTGGRVLGKDVPYGELHS